MKKILTFICIVFSMLTASAQTWLTSGNSGLTTSNYLGTNDAKDLIFKTNTIERGRVTATGSWRFGTATNNATVDSTGKLVFNGTGSYQVGGNKYAFQYSGNTKYGLFFNSTNVQYEFRNGNATPVFYVSASNGNGVFTGTLKIGSYTLPSTDGTNGQVLTTNGGGTVGWSTISVNSSQWTTNGSNIYYSGGNVGIGTSSPMAKLQVTGDALINGITVGRGNNSNDSTNVAIGNGALHSLTRGFFNVGLGFQSLYSDTTGADNIAIGYQSLYSNSYSDGNVAIGDQVLYKNTGDGNTGVGNSALNYNTTGSGNEAIGGSALYRNTTGFSNAANGTETLFNNTSGHENAATGYYALYTNTTGYHNTANGSYSLLENTVGIYNVANGTYSLEDNTTGNNNTSIGSYALIGNVTGSDNTAIGYNAGVSSNNLTNITAIGYNTVVDANNKIVVGNSSITSIGGFTDWTNFSDGRYKKNIKQNVPGLALINKLQPITYTLDVNGIEIKLHAHDKNIKTQDGKELPNVMNDPVMQKAMSEKSKIIYTGFVAQDVEKVAQSLGYDFSGVDKPKDDQESFYGLRYGDFVVPLVKAVQELSAKNDSLQKQNDVQQKINTDLQNQIDELKAMITSASSKVVTSTNTLSSQVVELGMNASLGQNAPNPFNNTTAINYFLPVNNGNAYLSFIASNGQTLKQIKLPGRGKSTLTVKANELPSGTYQYSLIVDGRLIDTKQMILAK